MNRISIRITLIFAIVLMTTISCQRKASTPTNSPSPSHATASITPSEAITEIFDLTSKDKFIRSNAGPGMFGPGTAKGIDTIVNRINWPLTLIDKHGDLVPLDPIKGEYKDFNPPFIFSRALVYAAALKQAGKKQIVMKLYPRMYPTYSLPVALIKKSQNKGHQSVHIDENDDSSDNNIYNINNEFFLSADWPWKASTTNSFQISEVRFGGPWALAGMTDSRRGTYVREINDALKSLRYLVPKSGKKFPLLFRARRSEADKKG